MTGNFTIGGALTTIGDAIFSDTVDFNTNIHQNFVPEIIMAH